jgi:pyruvate dehydrogenase (quinone)
MATSVGTFMLQRLVDWGVERVYGYPGDGINGILGGFHEVEGIEFTQVRHEEIASFAACAHAKFTGDVGVCLATSGPGAIHLLNGLYDAKLDHQPVVAIVGQQARMSLGSDYQQEVDLDALFKDVAAEFVQTCMVPQQAPHLIDRAMRIAKATRSPTCIIVPNDVQEADFEEPPRAHGAVFSSDAQLSSGRLVPSEAALRAAADVLNAGEKVAILIGQGAKRAPDEVRAVADALGAGVAKALNGRVGLLGTKPSNDMMEGCDTLLLVGTGFPYSEWLPEPGQARAVQIDIDARLVGNRYPTEVNLVGDAAQTLAALLPYLRPRATNEWRAEIESNVERWWEILDEQAHQAADPVNPQLVFHELSSRVPDGCILTADSGSATNWWARLRLEEREIFPMIEAALSPAAAAQLAAAVRAAERGGNYSS